MPSGREPFRPAESHTAVWRSLSWRRDFSRYMPSPAVNWKPLHHVSAHRKSRRRDGLATQGCRAPDRLVPARAESPPQRSLVSAETGRLASAPSAFRPPGQRSAGQLVLDGGRHDQPVGQRHHTHDCRRLRCVNELHRLPDQHPLRPAGAVCGSTATSVAAIGLTFDHRAEGLSGAA